MFRIRDILVQILIRGSVPLIFGSSFGSCSFHLWPSRRQQKIIFSPIFLFFVSYILKVHLHHFSKIQSHKKFTRVEIKVFPTNLLDDGSGRTKKIRMWIRNIAWIERNKWIFFVFFCKNRHYRKGLLWKRRHILEKPVERAVQQFQIFNFDVSSLANFVCIFPFAALV